MGIICSTSNKINDSSIHNLNTRISDTNIVISDNNSNNDDCNDCNDCNIILNWKAKNKTYKYHWWPMCERNKNDISNNLYAEGGGLHKYDILFDTNSVEYQRKHYYRDINNEQNDTYWAGFCDHASILSCLYKYPENDVLITHNNKTELFLKKDIEALMIIATKNAIKKDYSLFFGRRNNTDKCKDLQEPLPIDLLEMLKIVCYQEEPFIIDIDNKKSVWNYSYDEVLISTHKECHIPHKKLEYGQTTYYNFKLRSNAYPKQNQDLWGYVNVNTPTTTSTNKHITKERREQWISDTHPDFLWKNYGIDTIWNGECITNPCINASKVYEIYMASLNIKKDTIKNIELEF